MLAVSSGTIHNIYGIRVLFWLKRCLVCDAGVPQSGSSKPDSPDDISPVRLSGLQLGVMLEAERNYLLAIATQELGLHLNAKGGASDLVQDTFLNATRDLHNFSGRTSNEFRSWLRNILLNNLLNFRRQYLDAAKRDADREVPFGSTLQSINPDERMPSPSRVVMQAELLASLHAAKLTLPPVYQEIIELRSVQQLPFDEIALRLNRSADASRKLWCRAVEALQAELLTQNHDISGLR